MNLPSMTHKISLLVCSWRGFDILKRFVNDLKRSCVDDTKLLIVLNEGQKEEIEFLHDNKITFTCLYDNYGTQIVDVLMPLAKSEVCIWMNTDMYMSKGFDRCLYESVREYYPCAAQPKGIERRYSNDNIVYGDISLPEWMNNEAPIEFQKNVDNGKYNCDIRYGLFHPIAVKTSDVHKINYFGDNLNFEDFFPGHSCDSYAAYKLHKMNNDYIFLIMNNCFHYHYGSATNKLLKQINPQADARHNSENFNRLAGMTQQQFHKLIKYGEKVK